MFTDSKWLLKLWLNVSRFCLLASRQITLFVIIHLTCKVIIGLRLHNPCCYVVEEASHLWYAAVCCVKANEYEIIKPGKAIHHDKHLEPSDFQFVRSNIKG